MSQPAVASLPESLKDVSFPISREALLREYGAILIQMEHGLVLSLESALSDIVQPTFKSVSDVAVAVGELRRVDEVVSLDVSFE